MENTQRPDGFNDADVIIVPQVAIVVAAAGLVSGGQVISLGARFVGLQHHLTDGQLGGLF